MGTVHSEAVVMRRHGSFMEADALGNKQYILTLNSDKFHPDEMDHMKMDLDNYKRASFTKSERFLRRNYQEL
jgi:hypothetical protein